MYSANVDTATFEQLQRDGVDVVDPRPGPGGYEIDLVLSDSERAGLEAKGIGLTPFTDARGRTAQQLARGQAAGGYDVWRDYDGSDGLRRYLNKFAKQHKKIAKQVVIGKTVQGRDIVAIRISEKSKKKGKKGKSTPISKRPAVLYQGTTHAREWISTEVTRRLMEYFASKGKKAKQLRRKRQLWFVPVVNPDGYQYTFDTERLWRKNLRDNDGNGQITSADGVDLNRNYPERWGYDDEGSAGTTSDETYRGPSPGSEPETKADMKLIKKIDPAMAVSYHSYGPLLLYPQGWQVQTPTADDPIYIALSGTDAKPAIKGFDPDVAAELYTTNGEFTDWADGRKGALAWTPELNEGCDGCGFVFPDNEKRVEREYRINRPFAVDLARSAADPADPKSSLGTKTKPFYLKTTKLDPERANNPLSDLTFDVSYGDPQPVEILARRSVKDVEVRYRINGGPTINAPANPWKGGQTYDGYSVYYRYSRGKVTGTKPGDKVKVWFSGVEKRKSKKGKTKLKKLKSKSFTYTARSESKADALILSAEDYTGASPAQASGPSYLDYYEAGLDAAGIKYDVYDVDAEGRQAPDALGVLGHYDAVLWYTGDDVITREPAGQPGTASRLANDEMLEARSYMNDGGKLLYTGQYAGLQYQNGYFYDPLSNGPCDADDPSQTPRCLILSDDFLQYDLGAYIYNDDAGTDPDSGQPYPVDGVEDPFNGLGFDLNGPGGADNQEHTASFITTSSLLSKDRFPQFASAAPAIYDRGPGPAPFEPYDGTRYVYSNQADNSYKRLSHDVDLSPYTAGDTPKLQFRASYDTEPGWDYMLVEVHRAGQDDWTTLPAVDGGGDPITSDDTGDSCPSGWTEDLHPFLKHYETLSGDTCTPTGTTGEWNAATGRSAGWEEWNVDLSAYAGEQIEVSITYVSDYGFQGLGSWVDSAAITAAGGDLPGTTSFEQDADPLDGWTVAGPPADSPGNATDWEITGSVGYDEGAAVSTDNSLFFGFGLEAIDGAADRNETIARGMEYLLPAE